MYPKVSQRHFVDMVSSMHGGEASEAARGGEGQWGGSSRR